MNLRKLWRYSRGRLVWIGDGKAPKWNLAGGVPGRRYLACCTRGERFYYHHVVWLLHHARRPPRIDHIDRDRLNNRIENLRASTHTQNLWNSRHYANNTSGHRGVHKHRNLKRRPWQARLRVRGKTISLGYYATAAAAGRAFRAGARKHYGEFAHA